MRTLDDDARLKALPGAWAAASSQVESGPGLDCLTTEEMILFIDTGRGRGASDEERAIWSRARGHLADCSFCAREVGALFRARQEREARQRVRVALGERASRVAACVRVAVERARGAFTAADGLLSGIGGPARLVPVFSAAAFGPARGDAPWEDEPSGEGDALREVIVSGEGIAPADLQLSGEEESGEITLILREPLEVVLLFPDGGSQAVPLEESDGRYYASVERMPEGDYCLALLRPESPRG